jgi:hypothetical protein
VTDTTYDALVIGCGPGGSSVATFLARAGKRVLALEKEVFPRFHIGESLLPCNMIIFEEMGVMPALREAGFPIKYAAQFELGNGSICTRFVFREGRFNRAPDAIQVERALLDHLLLKHTRASGADVREGWTVSRFDADADGVSVEARDPAGKTHQFRGAYLIDATGRGNLTGNQENLREMHPKWKKLAVFGHFENVALDAGEPNTDTIIVRLENKWFWIIPLSATKTSVGIVFDKDEFTGAGGTPRGNLSALGRVHSAGQKAHEGRPPGGRDSNHQRFQLSQSPAGGASFVAGGRRGRFHGPHFFGGCFSGHVVGQTGGGSRPKCLARATRSAPVRGYEKRVRRGLRFYWRVVENTTPRRSWNCSCARQSLRSALRRQRGAGRGTGGRMVVALAPGVFLSAGQNPTLLPDRAAHFFRPEQAAETQPHRGAEKT